MGQLYDGDAVYANGGRPERVPPAASFDTSSFELAIGTYHAALAGDTLPMDLQVCLGT